MAVRGIRLVLALASLASCVRGPGRERASVLAPTAVPAAAVAVATAGSSSACRDPLAAELRAGGRGSAGCSIEREQALATLASRARRLVFGVVERRRVDLGGIDLVLAGARHCRSWPLRGPEDAVLGIGGATTAGCDVVRARTVVDLRVVDDRGVEHFATRIRTDDDGRAHVDFAALDAMLHARGLPPLSMLRWLELGTRGWAGTIDLARLAAISRAWHLRWVRRGRGVPGLFAALHADEASAGIARALAVEAMLARQERDYLAVAAGRMSPAAFLERYVWSPYRDSVEAMQSR